MGSPPFPAERSQGSLGKGAVPGPGQEMFQMILEHLIIKRAGGLLEASGVGSERGKLNIRQNYEGSGLK